MTEFLAEELTLGNGEQYTAGTSDFCLLIEDCYERAKWGKTHHLANRLLCLIVPDGGLVDTGDASAFAFSRVNLHTIREIIFIAPWRNAPHSGVYTTKSPSLRSPFGTSPRHPIGPGSGFNFSDECLQNTTLEYQLVLIQHCLQKAGIPLESFRITPLLYHDINATKLAHKLDQLIIPNETLLIICNRFDGSVEAMDQALSTILESHNNIEEIGNSASSARTAIAAFLQTRYAQFAQPELLHYQASANPRQKNIMAALAYVRSFSGATEDDSGVKSLNLQINWEQNLNPTLKQNLLAVLRGFLFDYLSHNKLPDISPLAIQHNLLNQEAACFISLFKHGKLRGQAGTIFPYRPLHLDLVTNCLKAALEDLRFEPVRLDELSELGLKVSILNKSQLLKAKSGFQLLDKIEAGKHGMILQQKNQRAIMLPESWHTVHNKLDFLGKLCLKAGLNKDAWQNQKLRLQLFSFETIDFME